MLQKDVGGIDMDIQMKRRRLTRYRDPQPDFRGLERAMDLVGKGIVGYPVRVRRRFIAEIAGARQQMNSFTRRFEANLVLLRTALANRSIVGDLVTGARIGRGAGQRVAGPAARI